MMSSRIERNQSDSATDRVKKETNERVNKRGYSVVSSSSTVWCVYIYAGCQCLPISIRLSRQSLLSLMDRRADKERQQAGWARDDDRRRI